MHTHYITRIYTHAVSVCTYYTHSHIAHMHAGCCAGIYLSNSSGLCHPCPANSNSTEQGVKECPCFDGYYRAMGEGDLPCTCEP